MSEFSPKQIEEFGYLFQKTNQETCHIPIIRKIFNRFQELMDDDDITESK